MTYRSNQLPFLQCVDITNYDPGDVFSLNDLEDFDIVHKIDAELVIKDESEE